MHNFRPFLSLYFYKDIGFFLGGAKGYFSPPPLKILRGPSPPYTPLPKPMIEEISVTLHATISRVQSAFTVQSPCRNTKNTHDGCLGKFIRDALISSLNKCLSTTRSCWLLIMQSSEEVKCLCIYCNCPHGQVIVIKICGSIAVLTILLKFIDCLSVSLCSPNMTQWLYM